MTGHNIVPASCEKPSYCTRCGIESGSALGHYMDPATCEKPETCRVCGKTEGEANGHNYVDGVCTVCTKKDPLYVPPADPDVPDPQDDDPDVPDPQNDDPDETEATQTPDGSEASEN